MKEVEQYKHTKEIYLNVFVFYLFGKILIRRIYFCLYIYISSFSSISYIRYYICIYCESLSIIIKEHIISLYTINL